MRAYRCSTCAEYHELIAGNESTAKKKYHRDLLDGHHIEQNEQRLTYWRAAARAHERPEHMMTILFDWMSSFRASMPQLRQPRKDAVFKKPGMQVTATLIYF